MLLRASWTEVKSPPDLATAITFWYRCGSTFLKAAAQVGVSGTAENILPATATATTAMQARTTGGMARTVRRELRFTLHLPFRGTIHRAIMRTSRQRITRSYNRG